MLITHEELFVNTVQDLRSKLKTNTPYSLIRACGLCRHLLLDEHPLLHLANRKYRLDIRFHVADYTNTPLSNNYNGAGGRTILPKVETTKKVKLEDFLKTKVLHYGRHEFTVREVIQAACHYFGGIHSGKPDSKQQYLSAFERHFKNETKMSIWMMQAICTVVLDSTKQLQREIKKDIRKGGFSPQY